MPPGTPTARTYVDLVTGPMLAACAPHARWVDVFCEPAARTPSTATRPARSSRPGRAAGLGLRVHGNQLGPGPGVRLAVELGAASVDHCTYLTDADVDALAGGDTVATLLPGVEFSTRSPYPDARRLLDAGVTVALATDCNPGTCYTSSMPFCIALAVREMGMTAGRGAVGGDRGRRGGAAADDVGHLGVGARADLAVLDAPSYLHLAYRPGVPHRAHARPADLGETGAMRPLIGITTYREQAQWGTWHVPAVLLPGGLRRRRRRGRWRAGAAADGRHERRGGRAGWTAWCWPAGRTSTPRATAGRPARTRPSLRPERDETELAAAAGRAGPGPAAAGHLPRDAAAQRRARRRPGAAPARRAEHRHPRPRAPGCSSAGRCGRSRAAGSHGLLGPDGARSTATTTRPSTGSRRA